ncbi:MAG: DNA-directed RNA polymerase subunit beta', partial [Parcubacteria group bacterium]|nr:DNA-directed RNA polymerase subunit beta' [Parcubacteria group bacterium]
PVSHIWFLRGVPSKMSLMLDIPVNDIERVIYFAGYIVTRVDEDARTKALEEIDKEYRSKLRGEKKDRESLKAARDNAREELRSLHHLQVLSEIEYHAVSLRYGHVFEAKIGAEAIRDIFCGIDLDVLARELTDYLERAPLSQRKKAMKRLNLVQGMRRAGVRPEWMFLTVLPVMPPDLRPMVQLDGGRYATSDLNDLYRRVINRNNRLKRLQELNAPEVITRNEKRMLQEAVDALVDNSIRRGQQPVSATTGPKRALRSLADMLKGKQGRFRQNLLGKRVDYSGRSVIVIGPELTVDHCGIPKKMALELFKPFVIRKLVERGIAHNIRSAGRLIDDEPDEVWELLEEATREACVLLNRAPTLHRLGIQAFKPTLIEGLAIQIHPLVCKAFNADFDGDQMAVHLPLSAEAQEEARQLMLSNRNLLKPATGDPIAVPTQDMVLGIYWMTKIREGLKGEGKIFGSAEEAIMAYNAQDTDLKASIRVRMRGEKFEGTPEKYIETSVGRLLFNEALPREFSYMNQEMTASVLERAVASLIQRYGADKTAETLDNIKQLGFAYATQSGVSWGMDDLHVPAEKAAIIIEAETEVQNLKQQYREGLLTDEERYDRVIEVWTRVREMIGKIIPKSLDPHGAVSTIIASGARGSWAQPTQLMGLKGLVTNPAGEIIELPIKSSFKEGFNVLEYFISTHGARKGSADTALRTATAGYLTRRLVDVAQDVVIREEDCGDKTGIVLYRSDSDEIRQSFASRIFSRMILEDVLDAHSSGRKKQYISKKGDATSQEQARRIDASAVPSVRVRSPLTCKSIMGVCQQCYGYDLGNNQLVRLGSAIGIVAAQAIGEPGTQLTMRTFHVGGVATGADITQGLPRVEEIFEARPPKGKAVLSEVDGTVSEIIDQGKLRILTIRIEGKGKSGETVEYRVPIRTTLWVKKDEKVYAGQQLSEGHMDLKELFKVSGIEAVQRYIIKEVQRIYTSEGAAIHDKHVETIVRQMFSRVRIKEGGGTHLTPGETVERSVVEHANSTVVGKGEHAVVSPVLLGITKVALTADSFLAAASFQETARVLISAAAEGKEDHLRGLKENVIIGKLIPAGTGFRQV